MPYFEPSRPMPLSFMPPKGATSVEMMPSLMPTMPYLRSHQTSSHSLRTSALASMSAGVPSNTMRPWPIT
jgi:hypothetical protein